LEQEEIEATAKKGLKMPNARARQFVWSGQLDSKI